MDNTGYSSYNNKNIVLNELIGLRVKVVRCLDKKQKGLEGRVTDETKNTLVVETRNGTKRIAKSSSTFRFYAGGRSFVVKGVEINFRPHERIEKGMKYYRKREL
jgi:ribonuclease P protein subunit POP4